MSIIINLACNLEQKGFKAKLGEHLKESERFLAGKEAPAPYPGKKLSNLVIF